MADNWISKKVQAGVAGVGNAIGGAINGVGSGVNGVGRGIGDGISNKARYLGQGVAGYGNDIKDYSGARGPRVATAGNPLGLAGVGSNKGGKITGGAKARPAGKGTAANPLGIGK